MTDGDGRESVYDDRDDVLSISIHQEHNYPIYTGGIEERGQGNGVGYNLSLPLHAGAGHSAYLHAMDRIVVPAIETYNPDIIIVACGFDAAVIDPLSTMLATADTFRQLTLKIMEVADKVCDGKLVLNHEGGYSEVYVPFCGHATLEALSGSSITAPDPFQRAFACRQPGERLDAFLISEINRMANILEL